MSGEQMASTGTHNRANSWLHLAGIPPQFLVPNEAPLTIGFTGCMQALQVNFTSTGFQFLKSKIQLLETTRNAVYNQCP
jgi:hypothetical protein